MPAGISIKEGLAMKNLTKFCGIIAVAAVMVFFLVSCGDSGGGGLITQEEKAQVLQWYAEDPGEFADFIASINEQYGYNLPGNPNNWTDADWNNFAKAMEAGFSETNSYPYSTDGNTLIFNPQKRGDGTSIYIPADPDCDKWDLDPATMGSFPVGTWENQDNNVIYDESVEFKTNGDFILTERNERDYSQTPGSTTASGYFDWHGKILQYSHSGNTLTFNPMGRGNGGVEYTPSNPRCDKWVLEGTGGTFPIGKWVGGESGHSTVEWVEFTSDGTMIMVREFHGTYTVTVADAASGIIKVTYKW